MRVLQFFKTAYPDTFGGIEQVIHQIARGSGKFGIDAEVLSLSRNPVPRSEDVEGYAHHRSRLDFEVASTGMSLSAIRRFSEVARGCDLVHFHFPWPFMDVVHLAARVGKPSIVTYHSDIVRQKYLSVAYRPLMARFLSDMDRIVATSPDYLRTSPVLDAYRSKTVVIPIGIDEASYARPSNARLQHWREQLGPRFLLFVGVLRYYKGLHVLLEALRGTNYPVAIVGDGPEAKLLRRQARELGLENVHFLGQLPEDDKSALLELCHGFVFPSHLRSEAFGVSLLEAAMCGKPLISAEIGTGTTFINIDGETGFVVAPEDPLALRRAIERLWTDPARAAAMGAAAAARYRKLFTAEIMVSAYARLYRELAKPDA